MRVIGLTGGIGMGKSTAAAAFRRAHVPVFDADAEVHRLQARRGAALPAIAAAFPGSVVDGVLDRAVLRQAVLSDKAALTVLERILHPLVRQSERRFLAQARRARARLAVLDIPLLFETGFDYGLDKVVVTSVDDATLRQRALARPGMSVEKLDALLARQTPQAEKRRRADYIVDTAGSLYETRQRVAELVALLTAQVNR